MLPDALGGLYRLPNFLSKGTQSLIPEMLMNDPVKRITIPEIRKHPWFLMNCPPYLQVPWEEYEKAHMSVAFNKSEFLDMLLRCVYKGLDRSAVIAAISGDAPNSQIKVTYELKLDEALKIERQRQICEAHAVVKGEPCEEKSGSEVGE